MPRILLFSILLLMLVSCGYRTLEGRARPVNFSADDIVFADSMFPMQNLVYQNMMRLGSPCLEVVDLEKGKIVQALIARPTIFTKNRLPFLVYPGEHILVTTDDTVNYLPVFKTTTENRTRNDELLVLKMFNELVKGPAVPLLYAPDYRAMLETEAALKDKIISAEKVAQRLFDSLCNMYHVSRKFKRQINGYGKNRYDLTTLSFCETYRDTFVAHNSFQPRVKALLPLVNGLTKASEFTLNIENNTNHLYAALFPNSGIRNMVGEVTGFQESFNSIVTNFDGLARDHLLSRLFYRCLEQGYSIPAGYLEQYRQYSINKTYRRIIARSSQHFKKATPKELVVPNKLLMEDGKKTVSLDSVMGQHKGRYVIADLWASWCVPCLEEIPSLQNLVNQYVNNDIAFLSVSIDVSADAWQKRIQQFHTQGITNYLLLKKDSAALVRQINLTTISRYLIFDKEGKLINYDAPLPSDPKLVKILDSLLLK